MTTDLKQRIIMVIVLGVLAGMVIGCQVGFWIDDYLIHKMLLTEKE